MVPDPVFAGAARNSAPQGYFMGFSPVSPEGAFKACWRDGADGGMRQLAATSQHLSNE